MNINWKNLAENKIKNAPNSDWRNRGELKISDPHIISITKYSKNGKQETENGEAVFVEFSNPLKDSFNPNDTRSWFTGFFLGAVEQDGKIFTDTAVKTGVPSLTDKDEWKSIASQISNRACPCCGKFGTFGVKSQKRRGPECIFLTYKCSACHYVSHDVFD